MTKKIVFCDRCGTEVEYPLSTNYKLQRKCEEYGESYFTEIDLCQNCIDSFEKWFSKSESLENE